MLIQKNPLTMVGTIDRCWLFTYQTPEADAQQLLPAPLLPVTHRGCAFWNVVVCHVDKMRPKGAPRALGMSYWHIAYRLYVRYPAENGPEIQGLYFVRSECDSKIMAMAGNLMTDFNFHTAQVDVDGGRICVGGQDSKNSSPSRFGRSSRGAHYPSPGRTEERGGVGNAVVGDTAPSALPPYSAFDHLDQAARFLKYKPYGISVDGHGTGNIVRIVRDERAWHARLVEAQADWSFFADKNVRPEICYEVDPIDYQWNRAYRVRQPAHQHGPVNRDRVPCPIALDGHDVPDRLR